MERVTLRILEEMLDDVDRKVDRDEFKNRSEAIRSAIADMDGVHEPERRDADERRSRLVTDGGGQASAPTDDGGGPEDAAGEGGEQYGNRTR